MVVSGPGLVARDGTTPGTTVSTVLPGGVEIASAPGPVAIEGALSDSLLETLEVLSEENALLSEDWVTKETLASRSSGETVRVGTAELASTLSSSCGKSVRVGRVGLVSAPELVSSELTAPETSAEPVTLGTAEAVCAAGWLTHGAVVACS